MRVDYFVVCENSQELVGGNANLIGVFNNIYSNQMPFVAHFCLASRISFSGEEIGKKYSYQLTVTDCLGRSILFNPIEVFADPSLLANSIAEVGVSVSCSTKVFHEFDAFGFYTFKCLLDGTEVASTVLGIVERSI